MKEKGQKSERNLHEDQNIELLWCVWMRQFKRVIHLFGEFEILCNEMFCLDREIKKYLKCMHSFFEVTQTGRTGPTTQMGQTGPMTQKDW